jgi:RNA polymerase sigma factor (sigma-70 family)
LQLGAPAATVFVVDDDTSVRRSVQRLLESVGLSVETFASAADYLAAEDGRPGCLIVDVRMPGLSGLDLQQELAARHLARPIIFITAHGDIPMSVRAMKMGAVDFLPKPFNEQSLLDAVNRALQKDADERQQSAQREEIEQRIAQLTPRERDVLVHVADGKMNKQIAAELGIAEKTVKIHRARVMDKMRANSLAELVLMAHSVDLHTTKVRPDTP